MDVEPIQIDIVSCWEGLYGLLTNAIMMHDWGSQNASGCLAGERLTHGMAESVGLGLLSEHKVPFPRSSVKPLSANQSQAYDLRSTPYWG